MVGDQTAYGGSIWFVYVLKRLHTRSLTASLSLKKDRTGKWIQLSVGMVKFEGRTVKLPGSIQAWLFASRPEAIEHF